MTSGGVAYCSETQGQTSQPGYILHLGGAEAKNIDNDEVSCLVCADSHSGR